MQESNQTKKQSRNLKKRIGQSVLALTCVGVGHFTIQNQLKFSVVEGKTNIEVEVKHPWIQDRAFKLWWGDEVLAEEIVPALEQSSIVFEKEVIAKQDKEQLKVEAPIIEEAEDAFIIKWNKAESPTVCRPLTVSINNKQSEINQKYCVATMIDHYQIRKGDLLVHSTDELEYTIMKKDLSNGIHEYEWVAVNQNGVETSQPISIEYYQFEMTADYKISNPTPYESLTYHVQQGERWVEMSSNDLTPHLKDSTHPELTSVEVTPNSNTQKITVSAKGKDLEEALMYRLKMTHADREFYSTLQTTYQSNIVYYEAGIGEVGSNPVKSEKGTFTFDSLKPGTYKVWVRAVDQAGNVSKVWTKEAIIKDLTVVTKPVVNNSSSSNQSSSSSSSSNSSSSNTSNSSSSSVSRPSGAKADMLYSMTSCYKGVSQSACHKIINAVNAVIPYHIVEMFHMNKTVIDIMPNNIRQIVRNITGWDAGWNYHGVTFINTHGQGKHIYTSLQGGRNVFIHEMGHMYDYYRGLPSRGSRFNSIYQAERHIFSSYYGSSSNEFFAESFRMYITEPSNLAKRAPQTYAYMKELIG